MPCRCCGCHLCCNLENQCLSPVMEKTNSIKLIGVNVATTVLSQVHLFGCHLVFYNFVDKYAEVYIYLEVKN